MKPDEPRRRFAPVPIETTFQSIKCGPQRQQQQQIPPPPSLPQSQPQGHIGPNPELTPEPSPRSLSPAIPDLPPLQPPQLQLLQQQQHHGLPPQQRRRFKPQLIETSRRTRRVGDPGPATRPTDKTDITPYTNHIYVAKPKPRRKRGDSQDDEPVRHMPPTRRETEDEGVKEYLLELASKEAARQIEEAALAAFPNSRAREGGVAHFYFHESSGSDGASEDTPEDHGQRLRRKSSSNLGLNWWHKHMQEHAEQIAEDRDDYEMAVDDDDAIMLRTDSDLDRMDLSLPPDPLWTTTNKLDPDDRRDSMAEMQSLRRAVSPIAEPHRFFGGDRPADAWGVADSRGPEARPAPGFLAPNAGVDVRDPGAGRPFASLGLQPEDPKLHLMRQAASPPMLGKDLTFRRCPSPKHTKLETDHPFVEDGGSAERNRDVSGQGGLWRGYCFRSESNTDFIVPADLHPAPMIVTPQVPGTPGGDSLGYDSLSEEPGSVYASASGSTSSGSSPPPSLWRPADQRPKNGSQAKGLHMLHGLDERLRREKAQVERDEKILHEFDDEFVTQVYNYLSLGYPAMARSFDEELSKITRVSVEELGRDDEKQMAKGHMLEMRLEDAAAEEARCPRWRALKTYIVEWARQHPNLDNLDPLAWGVRERRGSWAI
ncbi:siderophore iron transporter [Purpureocillium lavendulum]|uniref:Siderophore iron transporter n=1 Tax=Purpureocillium lavendulum TaxID=1247861 RepID=A0AB34FPN1_9HYPO|nr:siderophore iron transporter [Purpureocillium lavendulum]